MLLLHARSEQEALLLEQFRTYFSDFRNQSTGGSQSSLAFVYRRLRECQVAGKQRWRLVAPFLCRAAPRRMSKGLQRRQPISRCHMPRWLWLDKHGRVAAQRFYMQRQ